MLVKKKSQLVMLLALSSGILVGCSTNSSSKDNSTYQYVYATDPDSLDYIKSYRATTTDYTTQAVDGLLENDKYGNLVPSLAKDWTVSKDGLTYTYKLRKGAKWYTSDGEEYAEVKAKDFVAGVKHAADSGADALYMIQSSIKGLGDYVNGKTTDFSTVGVKALDDYTVQYTLTQPESYWNSKLTNQVLFPVNEEFLNSKGDKFGTTDPSSILYNGPYILKNLTSKSEIKFEKNENYWDADNVHITTVKYVYNDGSDSDSLFTNFDDGIYTGVGLNPNSSTYSAAVKKYKDNILYGAQDSTTYSLNFNLNRQATNFTKKTTDTQKSDTKQAILNKDFRQAIGFALDRTAYNAQRVGEDAASKSLRNTFVPPSFVSIGTENFGSAVETELASLGSEWTGVNLDDAQDGLYNKEKAQAEFAKAKTALQAQGVSFPIHLDFSVNKSYAVGVNQASSIKQSIEASLGKENVVVDINQLSEADYNNTTYYAQTASQMDWDLSIAGWSADYDDPSTYLDVYNPSNGSYVHQIGLTAGDTAIAKQAGLDSFETYLEAADAETSDVIKRYQEFAKAQAALTDSSVLIPLYSLGANPVITKITPHTGAYSWTGTKGSVTYKYKKIQSEAVTASDFAKSRKKWLKEKAKSNAEYEKNLAKHIAD
ncbi:peptide ABC transporter substrate-binding protein [Streptococcus saliviloxodontae]|uniref:Oligopeptide transport system substrate-binding protein n=1 Tax=Streptococcus saliviloxodontae TaxID=1349416 RepID=A0ABS2PJJ5_9STRE|nr:peptide ABC transporter substrate-binding protein [Streptococcus saliviloxodontae]MBM7635531.1 oligopeptide transport system substrate-binding protein [Streptococcus saliviloxodontae]